MDYPDGINGDLINERENHKTENMASISMRKISLIIASLVDGGTELELKSVGSL